MRWLRRSLWLAVWIAWLAAGVGLYRELPRELGPAVSEMPLIHHLSLGFVGDTNRFATISSSDDRTSTVDVFDAETGKLIFSKAGALFNDILWPRENPTKQAAVFAKGCWGAGDDKSRSGISKFDLLEGKWTTLSKRSITRFVVHPTKPWIAFVEDRVENAGTRRQRRSFDVVWVDWQTGSEQVVNTVGDGAAVTIADSMFFVADYDWLAVPIIPSQRPLGDLRTGLTEVWKLGERPSLVKTVEGLRVGGFPSVSANGRVAFADPQGTAAVEVFDLVEGRFVFSNMPRGERPAPPAMATPLPLPPTLSMDGRLVLGGEQPTVWDVDSGKVVRTHTSKTTVGETMSNTIYENEDWEAHWSTWSDYRLPFRTASTREFDTGKLIMRLIVRDRTLQPQYWNAARTLAVAHTGSVHRLPLPVNWTILAGCQAVLATPIVGLWTLLWWRRRRKLRAVVGAQPMR